MGIGFAPYWASPMNSNIRKKMAATWRNQKKPKTDAVFLGVLRSDVPILAGTPWNIAGWQKVAQERKAHVKWAKELKKLKGKKRTAHEANEPPNPPPPDIYEAATYRQRNTAGVWHESTLEPGEWAPRIPVEPPAKPARHRSRAPECRQPGAHPGEPHQSTET